MCLSRVEMHQNQCPQWSPLKPPQPFSSFKIFLPVISHWQSPFLFFLLNRQFIPSPANGSLVLAILSAETIYYCIIITDVMTIFFTKDIWRHGEIVQWPRYNVLYIQKACWLHPQHHMVPWTSREWAPQHRSKSRYHIPTVVEWGP